MATYAACSAFALTATPPRALASSLTLCLDIAATKGKDQVFHCLPHGFKGDVPHPKGPEMRLAEPYLGLEGFIHSTGRRDFRTLTEVGCAPFVPRPTD
jgi:hypothetical protein